jgi:L-fucose isomerase-like protein
VKHLRIAYLPIVRVQFDVALADQMIQAGRQSLQSAGFECVGPGQAISDLDSAQAAAAELSALGVDLIVIFQATFADSSMVTAIVEAIDAPIFLWSIPEPWTGGRLRLNSLCGINLAGHALTLRGRKYDYAYALPGDETIIATLRTLATAGNVARRLKSARLGVVGEHPGGMDTCNLDEPTLKRVFGVTIQTIQLEEVFSRARRIPQAELAEVRASLDVHLDNLATLQQQPLQGSLSVYRALKELATEYKLDGLAVRCWPEFFTQMGCAACGAMSMLSDGFGGAAPLPCSCEADINGTLTQLILQWLADAPAFGTDMVAADLEQDTMALWHCGLAPFSMADPGAKRQGGNHSNRGVPLVMDFPLKPGRVSIARISQATGQLRLVLGQGEILTAPKPFSGTCGVLRLDRPMHQFLDILMHEGLEHHVSVAYGDYLAELQAFARLANLPVLKF